MTSASEDGPMAPGPGWLVNWRKWGLGFSIEFGDPAFLRLWLGPLRLGLKWGHV